MVNIKNIHHVLVASHNVEEDIYKELEIIDRQYEEALCNLLNKMSVSKEEKKAVVLEAIRIPNFNGEIEEWLSFKICQINSYI